MLVSNSVIVAFRRTILAGARSGPATATLLALVCLQSSVAGAEDGGSAAQLSVDGGLGTPDAGIEGPDAGTTTDVGPQVRGSDAGMVPAGVVPPRLLEATKVPYPAAAVAAGVTGTVTLRLTIDGEGRVTEAEVLDSPGYGLDETARAAVLRFRFEPARRDGKPVRSRIRYEMVFEPAAGAGPKPSSGAKVTPTLGDATENAGPTAPSRPSALPARAEPAMEVTVHGASAAQRLRESAEAVTVVETEQARRESADLGEVLARNVGVSIRRTGGLGSGARFSLNGLTDDQVRFFLDGIPLDVAGFGLGLQNVPVNFIERAEIFRGVVPIRFGADALGGAVNLVSEENVRGTRAAASAQLGSFGTYRLTAAARHTHAPTGLYAAIDGFFDRALNDYPVDVEVPDDKGRLSPARVHRFHDRYGAYGGRAEVGVVNRSWAKRLTLGLHGTRMDKELQHNVVMSVPYGEVRHWDATRGATLRYDQPRLFGTSLGAEAVLAVSRRTTDFEDLSSWVYDWFGRRIRARVRRGELGLEPSDERIWQHTALGRFGMSWTPSTSHAFRLAVAPTWVDRTGRDYLVTMGRDPLSADRNYFTLTSGLEYKVDLFDRRLEVIGFGKSYLLGTSSEEALPGGIFRQLEQDSHTLGFGEALRLRLTRWLWAKVSYERATRLLRPDELFGDGVLIVPNLRLEPERSHNGNVSLTLDLRRTRLGDLRAEVNGFIRHAQNLVVLLGNDMVFSYQNVYTARSQGLEAVAGWTSPGGHLALDGNVTWQSLRNASNEGTFKDFDGDRIPNRPYLFANATVRVQKARVAVDGDELSLGYYLRYVNSFFRGWESLGLREFKQVVPDQTTHSTALTYVTRGALTLTWTGEVQNLTDAKTYDFFGVERPGRAFYLKVTAEH